MCGVSSDTNEPDMEALRSMVLQHPTIQRLYQLSVVYVGQSVFCTMLSCALTFVKFTLTILAEIDIALQ